MRLFTAVELDDGARRAIVGEQRRLGAALKNRSPRFVRAEHLHVTLVFLGEVDDIRGAELIEVMGVDVPRAPFQMTFAGVGVFPPRGAASVLWLGVTEGTEEVLDLHTYIAARLGAADPADRAFHPHVTLGRWGRRHPSGARSPLEQPGTPLASIRVDSVTLFASLLGPSGPTYTRLAQARLQCC